MSENLIEVDVVYDHNKHGEVLVTGIAKMYDEYKLDSTCHNPASDDEREVLVFYHNRFDGYGGMQPTPSTENVNEFAKHAVRDRTFDYDAVSDLRED